MEKVIQSLELLCEELLFFLIFLEFLCKKLMEDVDTFLIALFMNLTAVAGFCETNERFDAGAVVTDTGEKSLISHGAFDSRGVLEEVFEGVGYLCWL